VTDHNENRASLDRVAIDKGITHIARAGTETPPGILGAPMTSTPHETDRGESADRISPAVRADLKKLTPELARGVREAVARKR
jgi:hypothetical protein